MAFLGFLVLWFIVGVAWLIMKLDDGKADRWYDFVLMAPVLLMVWGMDRIKKLKN